MAGRSPSHLFLRPVLFVLGLVNYANTQSLVFVSRRGAARFGLLLPFVTEAFEPPRNHDQP